MADTDNFDLHQINEILSKVREEKPLIHHITNYLTANDCANITLHAGGLPVMADDINEVEEMVDFSSALVLNLGTLSKAQVEAMIKAGKEANKVGIPVLLDPVGAGATELRTESAKEILKEVKVSVLKGNFAEIAFLAGAESALIDVETERATDAIAQVAKNFASIEGITVAATGIIDLVTDGTKVLKVKSGHDLMSAIVGAGCMAGSVMSCFLAVEENSLTAAGAALITYGVAGEVAADLPQVSGPASFKIGLFDSIYNIKEEAILELGKFSFE